MLRHLKGKSVVILIDNDNPGREYGEYLARTIHDTAKNVKVILLPGLEEKGDVVDWAKISSSNDGAKLREIIAAAPLWRPSEEAGAEETTAETPAKKRMKRAESAELLLSLAMELPLYVDNECCVYTLSPDHQMLRVENTESLLTWRFHEIAGGYPSADSLKGVIRLLVAKGRVQGEHVTLFTRIGQGLQYMTSESR